mmetsp:Transcript_19830/g.30022  ORF Transcript_19830/g.30022 Transcript_19830/m.30022 type:complete len:90 (+) Transcript_19830:381-650(+)
MIAVLPAMALYSHPVASSVSSRNWLNFPTHKLKGLGQGFTTKSCSSSTSMPFLELSRSFCGCEDSDFCSPPFLGPMMRNYNMLGNGYTT